MHNKYRGLPYDPDFEQSNRNLRQKIRNIIDIKLIAHREHKNYHPCVRALDTIYCVNDMHYMLEILKSSRKNRLDYIIKRCKDMEERRYHRRSQVLWGFTRYP